MGASWLALLRATWVLCGKDAIMLRRRWRATLCRVALPALLLLGVHLASLGVDGGAALLAPLPSGAPPPAGMVIFAPRTDRALAAVAARVADSLSPAAELVALPQYASRAREAQRDRRMLDPFGDYEEPDWCKFRHESVFDALRCDGTGVGVVLTSFRICNDTLPFEPPDYEPDYDDGDDWGRKRQKTGAPTSSPSSTTDGWDPSPSPAPPDTGGWAPSWTDTTPSPPSTGFMWGGPQEMTDADNIACPQTGIYVQVPQPLLDPVSAIQMAHGSIGPWARVIQDAINAVTAETGLQTRPSQNFTTRIRSLDLINTVIDPLTYAGFTPDDAPSDELNPILWSPFAALEFVFMLFISLAPFELSANSAVTAERRELLDVALRVAGAPLGAIAMARFAVESVVVFLAAGMFTLTGFFIGKPLFALAPGFVLAVATAFGLSNVAYGQFFGVLFHKAENAASALFVQLVISAILLFLFTFLREIASNLYTTGVSWIALLSFIPNTAVLIGELFAQMFASSADALEDISTAADQGHFKVINETLEQSKFNLTAHLSSHPEYIPDYTLGQTLGFLFLDAFVFVFFAFYCMAVRPGQNGIARSVCFCLNPFYWLPIGRCKKASDSAIDVDALDADNHNAVAASLDPDLLRETRAAQRAAADHNGPRAALVLVDLTKLYKTGRILKRQDVRAVDAVTLVGHVGQVLSLVGHNGAGKSSLIGMLCGLSAPSYGDAVICGRSLVKEQEAASHFIGLCPQQNIVFPHLTVAENIRLFARLKRSVINKSDLDNLDVSHVSHDSRDPATAPSTGDDNDVPAALVSFDRHAESVEDQVTRVVAEVGLTDRRESYAHQLSGGMLRRLTLALALVGDPPIVVLDEPTAGLDPRTRRSIWNVIEGLRAKGKLVLLCTHDQSEAEALADKVALLALGRLRAVGSPAHLKKRFEVGYTVTINAMSDAAVAAVRQSIDERLPSLANVANIRESSVKIVYNVPNKAMSELLGLLGLLERGEIAGVRHHSVSQASMEELFIKLTHGTNKLREDDADAALASTFVINFADAATEELEGAVELDNDATFAVLRLKIMQRGRAFVRFRSPETGPMRIGDENKLIVREFGGNVIYLESNGDGDDDDEAAGDDKQKEQSARGALEAERRAHDVTKKRVAVLSERINDLQAKVDELETELRQLRD